MTELEKDAPQRPDLVGFRAIQSKRLYQQIAEQIEVYIGSGGLKPGDRLPSEREMAVMFGVSRPSVREAMIALEGAGLIEVRTGEGTFISGAGQSPLRFSGAALKGTGPGVLEQFQARLTLEPPLAAMAAERVGTAELAILRESVDAAEARFARGDLADDEDYAFHVQLAAFSGNRILSDVVRELWDLRSSETWRVIRARVATREQRLETVSRRRGILEALEARNGKLAEARMRELLDVAMHRYFGDTLPAKAKRLPKSKD